jgi:hypothetical protein
MIINGLDFERLERRLVRPHHELLLTSEYTDEQIDAMDDSTFARELTAARKRTEDRWEAARCAIDERFAPARRKRAFSTSIVHRVRQWWSKREKGG